MSSLSNLRLNESAASDVDPASRRFPSIPASASGSSNATAIVTPCQGKRRRSMQDHGQPEQHSAASAGTKRPSTGTGTGSQGRSSSSKMSRHMAADRLTSTSQAIHKGDKGPAMNREIAVARSRTKQQMTTRLLFAASLVSHKDKLGVVEIVKMLAERKIVQRLDSLLARLSRMRPYINRLAYAPRSGRRGWTSAWSDTTTTDLKSS